MSVHSLLKGVFRYVNQKNEKNELCYITASLDVFSRVDTGSHFWIINFKTLRPCWAKFKTILNRYVVIKTPKIRLHMNNLMTILLCHKNNFLTWLNRPWLSYNDNDFIHSMINSTWKIFDMMKNDRKKIMWKWQNELMSYQF